MSIEIQALGAILMRELDEKKEVVVFQRNENRTYHKNMFEIAMGGEFNEGELPENVLERELFEKTKIEPTMITYIGPILINHNKTKIIRHLFVCNFPENVNPQIDLSKHKTFIWKGIEDINDFSNFVPGTEEMLQMARLK